jgi:ABC-type multidrug transport system ATPase subunit
MRVVRNIGNSMRTIVCTIHQPSAEIFLHFDELLLLKRGGQQIYTGPLGRESATLVNYFQSVPGARPLRAGYNPASYMLEVQSPCMQTCCTSSNPSCEVHVATYLTLCAR